jgi:hypothetical protein
VNRMAGMTAAPPAGPGRRKAVARRVSQSPTARVFAFVATAVGIVAADLYVGSSYVRASAVKATTRDAVTPGN